MDRTERIERAWTKAAEIVNRLIDSGASTWRIHQAGRRMARLGIALDAHETLSLRSVDVLSSLS